MRTIFFNILFFFTATNLFVTEIYSQNKLDIIGFWYTPDKDCVVRIYEVSDKFYGKIVWQLNPYNDDGTSKTDFNNSDETLRSRALDGLIILKNFEFDDDEWINGTIYNPLDGNNYDAEMELSDNNTLEIRGFIGFSFLGKTTIWERKK